MAHCIRGPVLSIGRGAATQTTLGCIRAACRAAAEQLGTGYTIEPEAICEGGVRFACWPGKADDDSYKSMRFHGLYGWPLLNGNACDATPLHVEDARLDFFLKAYYGAPPFTVAELEAVASAVARTGLCRSFFNCGRQAMRSTTRTMLLLLACLPRSGSIRVSGSLQKARSATPRMGLFDQLREMATPGEKARISHVMLRTDAEACNLRTRGECYEMLSAWKERIGDDPELFRICAEERSECASNSKGGDLGFLTPAAKGFAQEFCKIAFEEEPGRVYGPIETQAGLHLLYLHSRQ